ncbi:phosphoribosyl transferase domain protein [Zymoseptoria brevis]|uniref:Phosphoribosyl transferase domain protein n=1 Tax=Zymoseptoria brevis TaxID=1047168 RepID=A0A0F4G8B3_9PEZI|nr:phosphoribosyl transferase domain protein [Zymoseptoria brevis]
MASLQKLKEALREQAIQAAPVSQRIPLSDSQYDVGFKALIDGLGKCAYQDFIIPQLLQTLAPLLDSGRTISVLEIGPGPQSVLGHLPDQLRHKIKRYTAFEPNVLFAERLQQSLSLTSDTTSPLPCLEGEPRIHRIAFALDTSAGVLEDGNEESFDVILFCHSMYGMKPKRSFIEKALTLLKEKPANGIVTKWLNRFAPFIAGYVMEQDDVEAIQQRWRQVCRELAEREDTRGSSLLFRSHDTITAFTSKDNAGSDPVTKLPLDRNSIVVKNREARTRRPAAGLKPRSIEEVQKCVHWALKSGNSLTVVGGGHSDHCIQPDVVAIDMSAFNQIDVAETEVSHDDPIVVVGAGCKSGEIISETMAKGLTVVLGSRPSVGAGLWLQGGIGHLVRHCGLACDAIVGAVVVSVATGEVLCIGHVPDQHQPPNALRLKNEEDLLWGLRGAGTNFGIVISVTLKAYPAPQYPVQSWIKPMSSSDDARIMLQRLDKRVVKKLPRHQSADAYLFSEAGKLHLGVSLYESFISEPPSSNSLLEAVLGPALGIQVVDCIGLFDTEMYMSGMHGGHAGGKTSSFKRCAFLKDIGAADIAEKLTAAINNRPPPAPRCYLHLLHGSGAVADVVPSATAFGCRDWDACVWVYDVVADLLLLSSGIYCADLGPDPRDAALAVKAFGPNGRRLARLKQRYDPSNVLAYTCPLPGLTRHQKLIVLVTGDSCAGKDFCAKVWASFLTTQNLNVHIASISDSTKREFAASTGANLKRLLEDRRYKEQERRALTEYYEDQLQQRPQLPVEHFLDVVQQAGDVDVLFITGMRDEAPVASFAHLVSESRLIEVHVQACGESRRDRGGVVAGNDAILGQGGKSKPTLIFSNEVTGHEAAVTFARDAVLPLLHEDLQRLAGLVRSVPDFPRSGINFRDIIGIVQRPDGLNLCAKLMRSHFAGDWTNVDAIVCCETGGFLFAPPLGALVNLPMVIMREAGKLPPPTVSVVKSASYISSSSSSAETSMQKTIEMGRDVLAKGASVLVVDDVLATGETLCAVLELLEVAGVDAVNIAVIVVAEFPLHRGREFLRRRGFGGVNIQSVLVLDGK